MRFNRLYLWTRAAVITLLALGLVALTGLVMAQDNPDGYPMPDSVTVAGTVQHLLGCPGDWQPDCAATELIPGTDDGVYQGQPQPAARNAHGRPGSISPDIDRCAASAN